METVLFFRSWRNYNRNDIAGFSPDIAKHLVQQGVARYYDAEEEEDREPQQFETRQVNTGQRRKKAPAKRRTLKNSSDTQVDEAEYEKK